MVAITCSQEHSTIHSKNLQKTYRENNREKIVSAVTQWKLDNPELVKKTSQKYYKKNKEKIKARVKEYNNNNREYIRERTRDWWHKNRERLNTKKRLRRLMNIEKHRMESNLLGETYRLLAAAYRDLLKEQGISVKQFLEQVNASPAIQGQPSRAAQNLARSKPERPDKHSTKRAKKGSKR